MNRDGDLHRLLAQHGYTADALADKVGKSKGYIYGRLKLQALPKAARRALQHGQSNASVALLIAPVPNDKLQEQACEHILCGYNGHGPMSYREAADYVHRTYARQLSGAPFDTKDADLVPESGSCTKCPKRTGNNRDLFGEVSRGDPCTDPACFRAKKDEAWKTRQERAAASGHSGIPERKAERLFYNDGSLILSSGYVDLAQGLRSRSQAARVPAAARQGRSGADAGA